jgi:outer membrane protease
LVALVINPQGFIKYSGIFEDNLQDSKSLKNIGATLHVKISSEKRATIIIDAGIATEENPKMLVDGNFDYVCVARTKLKDYRVSTDYKVVAVEDKRHQKITLRKVESEQHNDFSC